MQLAEGLSFLHANQIIHADVSCRNALMFHWDEDPTKIAVKLSEFGLAILLPLDEECVFRRQPRAVRWCAPETILDSKLSYKSDAWSLGAMLWELFSNGAAPWRSMAKRSDVAERLSQLAKQAQELDQFAEFPKANGCSPVFHAAVLSCLRVGEMERAHSNEVAFSLREAWQAPQARQRSSSSLPERQDEENMQEAEENVYDMLFPFGTVLKDKIIPARSDLEDGTAVRVFNRRKSRLNERTGEEEYFYPQDTGAESGSLTPPSPAAWSDASEAFTPPVPERPARCAEMPVPSAGLLSQSTSATSLQDQGSPFVWRTGLGDSSVSLTSLKAEAPSDVQPLRRYLPSARSGSAVLSPPRPGVDPVAEAGRVSGPLSAPRCGTPFSWHRNTGAAPPACRPTFLPARSQAFVYQSSSTFARQPPGGEPEEGVHVAAAHLGAHGGAAAARQGFPSHTAVGALRSRSEEVPVGSARRLRPGLLRHCAAHAGAHSRSLQTLQFS